MALTQLFCECLCTHLLFLATEAVQALVVRRGAELAARFVQDIIGNEAVFTKELLRLFVLDIFVIIVDLSFDIEETVAALLLCAATRVTLLLVLILVLFILFIILIVIVTICILLIRILILLVIVLLAVSAVRRSCCIRTVHLICSLFLVSVVGTLGAATQCTCTIFCICSMCILILHMVHGRRGLLRHVSRTSLLLDSIVHGGWWTAAAVSNHFIRDSPRRTFHPP